MLGGLSSVFCSFGFGGLSSARSPIAASSTPKRSAIRPWAVSPTARIWRGAVAREDAARYADYMRGTGVKEYAETDGNRGVLMLRRDDAARSEFVMVTLWESMEAVRGFAGDDVETAVFYPEDDAFLVEGDLTATHYEVEEARGF